VSDADAELEMFFDFEEDMQENAGVDAAGDSHEYALSGVDETLFLNDPLYVSGQHQERRKVECPGLTNRKNSLMKSTPNNRNRWKSKSP